MAIEMNDNESSVSADSITIDQYLFSSRKDNNCHHSQLIRSSDDNLVCIDCGASTRSELVTRSLKKLLIENARSSNRLINVRIELGPLFRILYSMGQEKPTSEDVLKKIEAIKEFEKKPYRYMDENRTNEEVSKIDNEIAEVDPDNYERLDKLQERKYKILLLSGISVEKLLKRNKGQAAGKKNLSNAVYSLMTTPPEAIKKEFGLSETPCEYLGTTNDAINKSIVRTLELKRN